MGILHLEQMSRGLIAFSEREKKMLKAIFFYV